MMRPASRIGSLEFGDTIPIPGSSGLSESYSRPVGPYPLPERCLPVPPNNRRRAR